MALVEQVYGTAIQRALLPVVQYILRYGLKPLVGIERLKALPTVWCRSEALRRLVGLNAQQVCQRGVTTRQGERPQGPRCSDILAKHRLQLNLWEMEVWCHGVIRVLATAGSLVPRAPGVRMALLWRRLSPLP